MNIAKSLTEEQIETIRSWAEAGDGLSEIQQKLQSDMEQKITYLETRFLLEDLKIELLPEPEPEPEPEEEDVAEDSGDSQEDEASEGQVGDAEASVRIDKVVRPGALVSGRVQFAGGKSTAWWLDQMGQLGMEPFEDGFKPNEEQLMSFQKGLQAAIQKSGL